MIDAFEAAEAPQERISSARLRSGAWVASRIAALVVAGGLFSFVLWYVWGAFTVPLELEIREGTGWLHALAKRAGLDIYDGRRVAFVNMNHGPMDPILKGWLAAGLPFLSGHMVIRAFVLLLPFVLLGAAYVICRRNWTDALLGASMLYLVMANVTHMLLVGRSDATLLCATAGAVALAHALLVRRHRHWTNGRYVALQVAFGACSAAMFLTTSRVLPIIAILLLLISAKQMSEASYRLWPTLFRGFGLFLAGFALVWLPVFLVELHGSWPLYFKRFFGFFLPESGWGTSRGAVYRTFPPELLQPRAAIFALMAGLLLLALHRLRRERAQVAVWMISLPAGWLASAYAYWANQGGGGLHYFFPYFIACWLLVLHGLRGRFRWRPVAQLAVAGLFVWCYPWTSMIENGRRFRELGAQSAAFLQQVAEVTKGEVVFGENSQLWKRRYRGEVVDCGDTVDAISRTRYFGRAFTETYERYLGELAANPPKFVLANLFSFERLADTSTPRLIELLRNDYRLAIVGPEATLANGGGRTVLYERKR